MPVTTDSSQLRATIERIKSNKEEALKAAGMSLLQDAQTAIKDQGPGWLPFKKLPKTSHELEDASGALLISLAMGGTDNIFQVQGDSITVGTAEPYAGYQNAGDSHIPARPFLFIDDTREEKAARAYSQRLLEGV